jgi:hypothetical protein
MSKKLRDFRFKIVLRFDTILANERVKELNCPTVSELRREIVKVKQRWAIIGWVTKNLLYRVPSCFGRHVKMLVQAALAPTILHWVCGVGNGLFSLCVIHKKGLCPSSGDINGLMMMNVSKLDNLFFKYFRTKKVITNFPSISSTHSISSRVYNNQETVFWIVHPTRQVVN